MLAAGGNRIAAAARLGVKRWTIERILAEARAREEVELDQVMSRADGRRHH